MIKSQLFIAIALLVGVAIGYFIRPSEATVENTTESEYKARAAIADQGESSSLLALRTKIARLEKLLAERDAKAQAAISNAVAEATRASPFMRPRKGPRERLEELKKSDPARYAQMTNRFAKFRQRRLERARDTLDFLSSIDTSHMSAKAKSTHGKLQEQLNRREEIEEQLHQEDLTDSQREQLMKEMRETDRSLRKLNSEERKNLFEETARNLGFSGDAVEDISATLQDVVEATNNGHGRFEPPPPADNPGGQAPGKPGGF